MRDTTQLVELDDRYIRYLEPPGYHEAGLWQGRMRYECDDPKCGFDTLREPEAEAHYDALHAKPEPKPGMIVLTDASGRPKQ